MSIQDALVQRFLRYSVITSQSDPYCATVPTSAGQRELAQLLQRELSGAGALDVHISDSAVVTAKIPATSGYETKDVVGFCTHLDTVDVNISPEVKAQVVTYDGGDILLNEEKDIWLRATEHPEITKYAGDRILVTDGTSVLGADDKAGVTTVMEAVTRILNEDASGQGTPHGDIYVSFVPDEEIGLRGVRTMDLTRFPVDYAYTLDSCELGEIVEATFNAGSVVVDIEGVTAHPMNAKDNLVNPILIAHDFVSHLDPLETPEHTEGREAYIWVHGISGNQATARIELNIRDHDLSGYREKKQRLQYIADSVAAKFPRAKVNITFEDVYSNLEAAKTADNAVAAERIMQAMNNLGITPIRLDMRGGTDGSWLSSQGIYTPNFFTGAHNFHSIYEFLPLKSFEKSYEMVREVIRLAAV